MIDQQFKLDVETGLAASPKFLMSKYLYDDKGSDLFRQIMDLPEYYLTRAELEIFTEKSDEIIEDIGSKAFNIIELGAGDGYKTKEFLRTLVKKNIAANYYPVDISQEALDQLMVNIEGIFPNECIELHNGDYFIELEKVYSSDVMEVIFFLGSNIGNYSSEKAIELLELIGEKIKPGDIILLGVDLKKEPHRVASAYNDAQGVTRDFNINLLARINRELEANFDLAEFEFYSHYDPVSGEVRSYLVSLKVQEVTVKALNRVFKFNKNELIHTELSKKYSLDDIAKLAEASGYDLDNYILDSNEYFAECILKKR
jgi:dimethylhistidine N-methyltransferase